MNSQISVLSIRFCFSKNCQQWTIVNTRDFKNLKSDKLLETIMVKLRRFPRKLTRRLGWAMVLGSFQCRGVLLHLHIVGQGLAVLAAGAGRVGYIFYIFHLSSLSNVLLFGRRLNMTEILWFRLLNPNGSCQLLPRTSSLSTG